MIRLSTVYLERWIKKKKGIPNGKKKNRINSKHNLGVLKCIKRGNMDYRNDYLTEVIRVIANNLVVL